MKKRILLSLVSFFMMTAMWASLIDAYQIYVTGSSAKTNSTAELTLNMKNKNAISTWSCTVALPAGVTFKSVALVPNRYPDANYDIVATDNGDGTDSFACAGDEGAALTGTDGAVATIMVEIAASVEPKDYVVVVKAGSKFVEPGGYKIDTDTKDREFTWTIEQGEVGLEGDLNKDGKVDIADAVTVLNIMASGDDIAEADLNKDGKIDIADFVTVLNIMAAQ